MNLNTYPEIKCGEMILKLDLDEPSEYAKEKALQELRETPENRLNGLKELKQLLKNETKLNVPMTDEWLIKFLRCCKFYPESARDLIKRYCNLRSKYPEVSNVLIPKKLKHVFEHNLVSIMPQRDQHGRRMIIALSGKQWDPKIISQSDIYSSTVLCTEALYLESETQINGIVYILDMEGLNFSRALKITPYSIKRLLDFLQDNTPARIKGLHIVNQPKLFQPIFSAAKPLFSTKYANRIIMHGSNYKSLHQYISPECLPKCYDGTLDMDITYGRETYELLEHYEKYFESMQTYSF